MENNKKVLPIIGYTVANGLLLDLDHYTPDDVLDICEDITKCYDWRCFANEKLQQTTNDIIWR